MDVWLWSARLTKTRADAARACRAGHVSIGDAVAKPATPVRVGDRIDARVGGRQRIVVVTRLLSRRVGAGPAAECYEDRSPPPPPRERADGAAFAVRDPGSGRPTKRDRRRTDALRGRRR
ncbi:RNA-binding S4 domain-containing protein [Ilumatobacter sp.]|uniref:RNA-binding S4 domain-containing protein n=1 Tax=Ilumatobacter sp. TaxID=1967498 RepID=UPI003B51CF0E